MRPRSARVIVMALLIFAAIFPGCARRPVTAAASAPPPIAAPLAPGTPPPAAAPPPALAAPLPSPPAPAPPGVARPSPKDFLATADLKDIHFDFDKYNIRPKDAELLSANAQWLKVHPNYLVLIEGHCDERGTNEYNLALGERRAKSAMNYLIAQGVQARRINIITYGEERPLCREKNEACWSKNRRDQFLVKPE
jgi:peptidoglycan-associated lipoprotein